MGGGGLWLAWNINLTTLYLCHISSIPEVDYSRSICYILSVPVMRADHLHF